MPIDKLYRVSCDRCGNPAQAPQRSKLVAAEYAASVGYVHTTMMGFHAWLCHSCSLELARKEAVK